MNLRVKYRSGASFSAPLGNEDIEATIANVVMKDATWWRIGHDDGSITLIHMVEVEQVRFEP